MKARVLATVAVAALAVTACGPIPPPPPGSLPETAIPVVSPTLTFDWVDTADGFTPQERAAVRLRVATCRGWANGSGFILNENQIITNRHVIRDATRIEITTYDGHDYVAVSWLVAPVADLAIVTVDASLEDAATLSTGTLSEGAPVTVVGYPSGQALVVSDGHYMRDEPDDVEMTMEQVHVFQLPSKQGSSGSAIYDEHGEVAAILYAGNEATVSLGWQVSWLHALLDGTDSWMPAERSC